LAPSHIFFSVKCNTGGTARGSLGHAVCGGIFRDNNANSLGCFEAYIGNSTSFHAKLVAAMLAYNNGWKFIWLESDSDLVNL